MADIAFSAGIRQQHAAAKSMADLYQLQLLRPQASPPTDAAAGDPVDRFTASGLSRRARDLASLHDSIGRAVRVIEATDKGFRSLRSLLESALDAARQALDSPSLTNKIVGRRQDIAEGTRLVGARPGTFAAGKVIRLNGMPVLTANSSSTVRDLIDGINRNTILNPLGGARRVEAVLEPGGRLRIEQLDGAPLSITTDDVNAVFGTLFGPGVETVFPAPTDNPFRKVLAAEFDAHLAQVDQVAAGAGYNGKNLLDSGELKVRFDDRDSASVTFTGVQFDAAGLGLSPATNHWQSDKDINDAVGAMKIAWDRLHEQALVFSAGLAAIQGHGEFTADMTVTLAGPPPPDLDDQDEEAARLVTLTVRQQLAATAHGLASQAEKGVLRLF